MGWDEDEKRVINSYVEDEKRVINSYVEDETLRNELRELKKKNAKAIFFFNQ